MGDGAAGVVHRNFVLLGAIARDVLHHYLVDAASILAVDAKCVHMLKGRLLLSVRVLTAL